MRTLQFSGTDPRDLIEVLISAIDVTRSEGKPAVEFQGHVHAALMELIDYFPDDELSAEHQTKVDAVFKAKQHGYRRTARNIVTRIHRLDRERHIGAAYVFDDALRPTYRVNRENFARLFERPSFPLMEYKVPVLAKRLGDCTGTEVERIGRLQIALANLMKQVAEDDITADDIKRNLSVVFSSNSMSFRNGDLDFFADKLRARSDIFLTVTGD